MTEIVARRIGAGRHPVVVVDGFHPDPDALRAFAAGQRFEPARLGYPGIRAPLPADYFARVRPALVKVLSGVFAATASPDLLDASFSIVTTPPDRLTPAQRYPHVDAVDANRIAFVHYLSPAGGDGTAFFRHRATGVEQVTAETAPAVFAHVRKQPERAGYYREDDPFEQIAAVSARDNRAVIYRSALFHTGAISEEATFSPDPLAGRLTVTAFLLLR